MSKNKSIGFISLILISSIIAVSTFQNCAKVNYQENEKTTGGQSTQNTITKTVQINPTFNPVNADMKILFVVDDSFTMSQSQQRLSNALDTLLNPLEGRNVEFKIVSTSGLPNNLIDYVISSQAVSTSVTEYSVSNAVNNRHGLLKSLSNFNSSQFNSLKLQVKNAILAVGTNGSDTEEGICAAVRQLFDTSSNRFFRSGDKSAIVFLTDENDASQFSNCLSQYEMNTQSGQVVYYNYSQQRTRIQLEYKVDRDGLEYWYPVTWEIPLQTPNNFSNGSTCSTNDLTKSIMNVQDLGYQVRNVTTCTYVLNPATFYGADLGDDGSVAGKNLCTSTVTYQGHTYTNLYSFISASEYAAQSGTCQKQVISSSSLSASPNWISVVNSDTVALQAQDLSSALVNKSNELFGSGFIVASLIRKNGESCALQSGQSYGTKYLQLSDRLGDQAVTESLCASSFSNVLNKVSQFIKAESLKSYVVPNMATDEKVFSVAVRRNGVDTALTTSQFESVGSTVTLTDYTLYAGDIILVTYGK